MIRRYLPLNGLRAFEAAARHASLTRAAIELSDTPAALARFDDGRGRELLSVGAVGSFAVVWLLPRLAAFEAAHPEVDLRLSINNNRVDIAEEGSISRSASAMAPGTAPRRSCSSRRRSPRCATLRPRPG